MKEVIITLRCGKSEVYSIEDTDTISINKAMNTILIHGSNGSIRMILNISEIVAFYIR